MDSMQKHSLTVLTLALITGCVGPDKYTRFTAEKPPCRLPALTEQQVNAIARKTLGDWYKKENLPEPIHRVTEVGCIYRYEESAFYWKREPVSLDTVDGETILLVDRSGGVL